MSRRTGRQRSSSGRSSSGRSSSGRSSSGRDSRRDASSIVVSGLLFFGLLAFCGAVTLPTLSLLAASPASMVSTPPALDPTTASNAGGLLVIALTATALGVVLAVFGAFRLALNS